MWIQLLACLVLALSGAEALTRNDCSNRALTPVEETMVGAFCTRNAINAIHPGETIVISDPTNNRNFLVCTDVAAGCTGTCPNGGIFNKATHGCGSRSVSCPLPRGADPNIQYQPRNKLLGNPCPRAGGRTCVLFPHNTQNRFILCESTTAVPKVGQCLSGFVFNEFKQACVSTSSSHMIVCASNQNPCIPIPVGQKLISADQLYWGCSDDPTAFIHCDRWGHMTLKHCRKGTVWSQDSLACIHK